MARIARLSSIGAPAAAGAALVLLACAALLLLPGPRRPFAAFTERLMASAEVIRPEGEGPFPIVLQFHGCGGIPSSQAQYAEVARDAGWATVIVDSYAPRRISRGEATLVCHGFELWGRERAGDVYAAMAWAREQPWADG